MTATVVKNARWAGAKARLSVLTPFKGDDPSPLLVALAGEADAPAELVLLDDGSAETPVATAAARAPVARDHDHDHRGEPEQQVLERGHGHAGEERELGVEGRVGEARPHEDDCH